MPGVLQGQSFDFLTTARLHAMGANGIIGIPFFTVCTLLIGFIIFGIVIQNSGGGIFFYNLAHSLLGQSRGGAAKIGILGSSFFGMLSGSTVSNVSGDRVHDHTRHETHGFRPPLCRGH